jgi:surface polysaccharide O-acyltransferase-like enzyme
LLFTLVYALGIIFPVGWVLKPPGFQPGHFTQYISLFVLGIVALGNDWLSRLSRSAFAVYIFHPLLVISLSLAVRNRSIDPAMKLLVVAPLAVIGSFLPGSLLVNIPGVKKII